MSSAYDPATNGPGVRSLIEPICSARYFENGILTHDLKCGAASRAVKVPIRYSMLATKAGVILDDEVALCCFNSSAHNLRSSGRLGGRMAKPPTLLHCSVPGRWFDRRRRPSRWRLLVAYAWPA